MTKRNRKAMFSVVGWAMFFVVCYLFYIVAASVMSMP